MMKIISGGQTGVDKIALQVALVLGFKTGGTAPKGWWTEDGPDGTLETIYKLTQYGTYATRTVRNIIDSDGTIVINPKNTPGTLRTIAACKDLNKPYKENPTPDEIAKFMKMKKVVNFAGPRRSHLNQAETEEITETITKGLTIYKQCFMQV